MRLIIFTDFTLVIVVKKNFQELFGCGVRLSLTRTSRGMHHSPDFLSFKFEVNNAMTVQTFTYHASGVCAQLEERSPRSRLTIPTRLPVREYFWLALRQNVQP